MNADHPLSGQGFGDAVGNGVERDQGNIVPNGKCMGNLSPDRNPADAPGAGGGNINVPHTWERFGEL